MARLADLADKWTHGYTTVEEVKDLIVKEQLIDTLPENIRVYVKERKPATSQEAGELADDHTRMKKAIILRLPCQHDAADAKSWAIQRRISSLRKGRVNPLPH